MTNTVNLDTINSKGRDVNAKDENGNTPLMAASIEGHFEKVKVLLDNGADVNSKTVQGYTALTVASWKSYIKVIKLLKAHGAKE